MKTKHEFQAGDELWFFDESVGLFVKVRLLSFGQNYWWCERVELEEKLKNKFQHEI